MLIKHISILENAFNFQNAAIHFTSYYNSQGTVNSTTDS